MICRAVHSDLFLYAEDSRLIFQHIDVQIIEHQLNKVFANLCEWFVDNKLSIHFGEDRTKCILLGSKLKLKNAGKFHIMHKAILHIFGLLTRRDNVWRINGIKNH